MTLQASQEPAGSGETSSPSPSPEEQSRSEHKSRVEAALARAGIRKEEREVAESEVVEEAAPDPKARATRSAGSDSSAKNTSDSGSKPSDGAAKKPSNSTETAEDSESAKDRAPPQPRYDSDSFRKWAKNNPEKAAELAAKHFKVELGGNAEGWKKHFIALEKKSQKQQESWDERTKVQDERDTAFKTQSEELLGTVQPILDVMEAEQKNDFPAVDAFIETTFRISFDEYCKRRLRGLAGSTTAERVQKVQLSKKDQEIADLKAKLEAAEKKPETKTTPKPKVSEKWIASELPEDHGVRDLANWEDKVQEAYQDSYDGEDYGLTIEEAADQVLGAFLKKGKREPEPVTNGKGKPKPPKKAPPKVHTDDDEEEDTRVNRHSKEDNEEYIEDFQQRVARALEKRARGR